MRLKHFVYFLTAILISCSSNDSMEEEEMTMVKEEMIGEEEETPSNLMGDFMNGAHPTSGTATINDNKTELILTNFKTDAGPLLELYIATDTNATDYVSLGVLTGLEGDFSYELPLGVNFSTHNIIMVWCVDFDVNFGHAILE